MREVWVRKDNGRPAALQISVETERVGTWPNGSPRLRAEVCVRVGDSGTWGRLGVDQGKRFAELVVNATIEAEQIEAGGVAEW